MFLKFVILLLSLSIADCGKAKLDYIYEEGLNYDYQYQADYQADFFNDSQQYPDYVDNSHENQSESIEEPETINRRVPKILSNPREIIVNEGATIKLPCEVDTLDNLVLIWYHGEKIGEKLLSMGDNSMVDEPRLSLEANGTGLVISLAVPSDSGKYRCKVSTQENVEIEHTVRIRVAPLVKAIQTVPVMAGDDALLKCSAEQGFPQPDLYWTRENHKFRDGRNKNTGSEIWLTKVTRKDGGKYTCHGDNKWNYIANDTIHLQVLYAPEIEQQETFIHTKENDEVEVTCLVHASPPAEVEWYLNGQLLERDDNVIYERGNRHNIIISKLGKHYYGKYMCRAINKYGEQSKTTEVSGRAKSVIYKSMPNGMEHDEYLLQWWTASNSPVTQFRVDFRPVVGGEMDWTEEFVLPAQSDIESSDTYSGELILENLDPGKKYLVKIESKNDYGWSDHKNQFEFSTKPKHSQRVENPPKPSPSVSGSDTVAKVSRIIPMLMVVIVYSFAESRRLVIS